MQLELQGKVAVVTTPEEVVDLMLFLASARGANVTGADFTIDGELIKTL